MSRILFVTNDFPTRRGGIESFILALCERMPADEVVVYTASMPGDREYDAGLPFPVYRDPAGDAAADAGGGAPGHRGDAAARLRPRRLRRLRAAGPAGARACARPGARRMVALTHGHEVWWARVPVARQLLRRIGDSVDVMTYVSEWCRDRIAPALSPDAAARMQRLSPGVDTERFYPGCGGAEVRERLGISADAPVVVCTARMIKRKGQDTLVKAWPEVLRRAAGRAAAARRRRAATGRRWSGSRSDSGCADSVIFTGSVPWDEVPAYTDAGDVFAMPCRTRLFGLEPEAFGIVFLEAQACGLPVLVGDSGGAPEAVAAGADRVVRSAIAVDAAAQIAGCAPSATTVDWMSRSVPGRRGCAAELELATRGRRSCGALASVALDQAQQRWQLDWSTLCRLMLLARRRE